LNRTQANRWVIKEALNKLIPLMVRQGSPERRRRAHHERNQYVTVHPELAEGFNQRFLKQRLFFSPLIGLGYKK
jgi:hypothetical protein